MTAKIEDHRSRCRDPEAVLFIWTVFPYRAEWRHSVLSHKMITLDAGYICHKPYLTSEAIGAGICAIGAFWQDEVDTIRDVDGETEFPLYVAWVGKI